MKKILALILATLMLAGTFAACKSAEAPEAQAPAQAEATTETTEATADAAAPAEEAADGEKKTIGISLFYKRDEYYMDLEAGFKEAAEAAGYELIIMDADADAAKQMQQVEDFTTKGVDAIALAACDPDGLVPAIEAATEKGIPVFTYDGPANTDAVITHVGFDFFEDGQLAGEWAKKYINETLGGKAKVAIIDFPQSAIVCAQRADGFASIMETMEGVEIVARQDGKATRTDSMSVTENILTAHPDVDLVYGINYDTGAGAKAAIEAAGSKAVVCCNAWGGEGFQQLEDNDAVMKCLVVSSPAVQAADTIKAMTEYFAGAEIPKQYLSHSTAYDNSNIADLPWREIIAKRG